MNLPLTLKWKNKNKSFEMCTDIDCFIQIMTINCVVYIVLLFYNCIASHTLVMKVLRKC